ncbi:MAG: glycosyltransferase [Candidatus Pacearchaeota archaeon]
MIIGIDISQLAYEGTGVANYLQDLIQKLLEIDKKNEYVLFFSSLRKNFQFSILNFKADQNVKVKRFKLPPVLLDFLWNRLHIFPIENFIGEVDIFITSDWLEPPVKKAKKATILYDLIIYKYPKETDQKVIKTQKRKLEWVKKESDIIFCISESTKKDAIEILKIPESKLRVIYPGI